LKKFNIYVKTQYPPESGGIAMEESFEGLAAEKAEALEEMVFRALLEE